MKFPNLADLESEQRRIYSTAPTTGSILITGAPGTGKTIMAFHRAHKLQELGESPHVVMYNKVLKAYTNSRSGVATDIPVSTMHKWVYQWWRRFGNSKRIPGENYKIDWDAILERALQELTSATERSKTISWGHLLIDEGQDFPKEMYFTLGKLARHKSLVGKAQLTIFADDNQRMDEQSNSETKEIRDYLLIDGDEQRNFVLRKNFRNSQEIAKFARHFQVSQHSHQLELPNRRGGLPQVVFSPDDASLTPFIARKIKANPGRQVGIIVRGSGKRVRQVFNKLSHALAGTSSVVQMYLSDDEANLADNLDFIRTDSITVLHEKSSKGLEFDIVFYVGLETIDLNSSGGLNERMALYVMASRARVDLTVVFNDMSPLHPLPASVGMMPSPKSGLCRFSGLGEWDDKAVKNLLNGVQWIEPLIGVGASI
jgi:superfamily I DNA/RNA helicase